MAVLQSAYMTGSKQVPTPCEAGEVYELKFKIDTAVTNLGIGDFYQLFQIPANCVLSDIRIGASATLGSTTVAAGIADALATTALSTTYIAAGALTTTAVVRANASIMDDDPLAAPTSGQRIVTLAIAAEAESTNVLYASVQYRASNYLD
jgi:hypothetical protein